MALQANGISMSYSCAELIKEVRHDVLEFGDIKVLAFYEKKDGVNVVTDYIWKEDMSDEEMELRELAPLEKEYVWKTTAKKLLKYLRLQDDPVSINQEVQSYIA